MLSAKCYSLLFKELFTFEPLKRFKNSDPPLKKSCGICPPLSSHSHLSSKILLLWMYGCILDPFVTESNYHLYSDLCSAFCSCLVDCIGYASLRNTQSRSNTVLASMSYSVLLDNLGLHKAMCTQK